MSRRSSIRKSELRELAASLSLPTEGLKSELDNRIYEFLTANPSYQTDSRFALFYQQTPSSPKEDTSSPNLIPVSMDSSASPPEERLSDSSSPRGDEGEIVEITEIEIRDSDEDGVEEEEDNEELIEYDSSDSSNLSDDSDSSYVELPTLYSKLSDKFLIYNYLIQERLALIPQLIHDINEPIRYFCSDIRVINNLSILIELSYLVYNLIPWTYYAFITSSEDLHTNAFESFHHAHLAVKVLKVPGFLNPLYKKLIESVYLKWSTTHDRVFVYSPDWEVVRSRAFLQFIAVWFMTMVVVPNVVAYYVNFTQREHHVDFAQLEDDNDQDHTDDEDYYNDDDNDDDESDAYDDSDLEEEIVHDLDEETKLDAVRHGESYEIDDLYDFEQNDNPSSDSESDNEGYQHYFHRLSGGRQRKGTLAFIKDHMDPLIFSITRIIMAHYLLEPIIRNFLVEFSNYTPLGHLIDNTRGIAVTGGVVGAVLSFWIARD
ncbi:hypothetical protein NADFUDRAFT_46349 [Nadsonia fulvescens var. elongata DSM 6958]|uniref:SAP domain-containing protein n=1 Tax=Nadsonia fulvescens var. elongata DSM 6958 TaxID=857566 RepID=A0A1E3PKI4_9ASCO|nr:hypothetical protein NADFUDRAFT_46349 [Nadsonia fulvescens var. elongata DSM 6958]